MTLHATRDGQKITIHGNIGVDAEVRDSRVQAVHITEPDAQHLKHFWSQLGGLLEEADQERAAADD